MKTNAKQELLEVLESTSKSVGDITAMCIFAYDYAVHFRTSDVQSYDILEALDFEYDAGYGTQELHGIVLFNDNTWLERAEYDGSEWWEYKKPPTVKDILN